MKKIVFYLTIFIFLSLFVGMQTTSAAGLSIGSPCKDNNECQSNDCETSSKEDPQGNNLRYCDCGELDTSFINPSDSQDCVDKYGGIKDDWTCADGADLTWDLDYCKNNNDIHKTEFPIPPKKDTASVIDMLLDSTAVTAQMFKEIDNIVATPQPKISIPGLKFSEPKTVEEPGGKFLYIPFLGDYISSLYKYLIIVASIIATAMIIKAGFDWLMSGGESEKITHAKTRIGQSLMGLFIAVSSYFILNLINPNLVEFKNLRVRYVIPKTVQDVVGDLTQDLTPADSTFISSPTANVPLFKQTKSSGQSWWNVPFGDCGTIQTSGCGPTSLAMVLKKYGYDVTPAAMAQEWASLGYRKCSSSATPPACGGCSNAGHGGMFTDEKFLEKYKLKSSSLGKNKESIIKALQAGKPVIVSVSKSIFTANAHFIVLTGINADGTISVNDPNKNIYCSNGETKCDSSMQTIKPGSVPPNLLFPFVKAATVIEPK